MEPFYNNNNCNNLVSHIYPTLSSSSSSSTTQSDKIAELPFDPALEIFSYLETIELARNCSVCSLWNHSIQHLKYSQNIVDHFAELVNENSLTWNKVGNYSNLSLSLERKLIKNRYMAVPYFIRRENQELANEPYPDLKIIQPIVKYGDLTFYISNSIDVKIFDKTLNTVTTVSGEKEKTLVALSVEGQYLFALRKDGLIIKWNYLNKQQERIETAYAKQDPQILHAQNNLKNFYNDFLVQKDHIILCYSSLPDATFRPIEIISVKNPKDRVIINTSIYSPHHILVQNNKLYVNANEKIFIYDLKNKTTKIIKDFMADRFLITDFLIDHNKLYFCESSFKPTKVLDFNTEKILNTLPINFHSLFGKVGNLLIGDISKEKEQQNRIIEVFYSVVVYDLNLKETVKTINDPYNFDKLCIPGIKPDVWKELILFLKNYKEKPIQEEVKSKTNRWCLIS